MDSRQHQSEEEAMLLSQVNMTKILHGFVDIMVIKCAVELRLADIIHKHDGPVSLSYIASKIDTKSAVDVNGLSRIMRFLVDRKIFDSISNESETLYSLNYSSRWLLRDSALSMAHLFLLVNHPSSTSPFHYLGDSIRDASTGSAFHKANGREIWELASNNPEFNDSINRTMKSNTLTTSRAVLSKYEDGFSCINSLVDVGGGIGALMVEILNVHPHIKAINFDLSHVVAKAPAYPGLSHVGGDMFKDIPSADAILLKTVLHDWSDEDCVKILKNCRKSIPAKTGKIIIVEIVLKEGGDGLFDDIGLAFDITMLALFPGGKERTELEWKILLEQAGFPRYNIIKLPATLSIIEAFPE